MSKNVKKSVVIEFKGDFQDIVNNYKAAMETINKNTNLKDHVKLDNLQKANDLLREYQQALQRTETFTITDETTPEEVTKIHTAMKALEAQGLEVAKAFKAIGNDLPKALSEAQLSEAEERLKKVTIQARKLRDVYNADKTAENKVARDKAMDQVSKQRRTMGLPEVSTVEDLSRRLDHLNSQFRKNNDELVSKKGHFEELGRQGSASLNKVAQSTKEAKQHTADGKNATEAWGKTMEDVGKKVSFILGIQVANAIKNGVIRTMRQAVRTVMQLDKSLTEIATVTGRSRDSMWSNFNEFNTLAKDLGTTTQDLINSSVLFYRQGKSTHEVLELVNASVISAGIANISTAESSDRLTSALNGFQLEAHKAMRVADRFANLAANSASSFDELSIALSKTAASAYTAGIDIDHMLGYLAKTIETTREAPTNIGTAFKTIIARMQQLKDMGHAMGEDGIAVSFNEVDRALQTVGISLKDEVTGQFRDLQYVIDELGGKWDGLDRNTQAYLATVIAGSRQQSRFLALMNNYARTTELVALSQNSNNAAMKQFEIHLTGSEAAMNRLKTTMEALYRQLFDAGTIEGFIGLLEKLASAAIVADKAVGLLGASVAAIAGLKIASKMGPLLMTIDEMAISNAGLMGRLAVKIKGAGTAAGAAAVKFTALQAVLWTLGAALGAVALVVGISFVIKKIVDYNRKLQEHEVALQNAHIAYADFLEARREQVEGSGRAVQAIKEETDAYKELVKQYEAANTEQERRQIGIRLAQMNPDIAFGEGGQVDNLNEASQQFFSERERLAAEHIENMREITFSNPLESDEFLRLEESVSSYDNLEQELKEKIGYVEEMYGSLEENRHLIPGYFLAEIARLENAIESGRELNHLQKIKMQKFIALAQSNGALVGEVFIAEAQKSINEGAIEAPDSLLEMIAGFLVTSGEKTEEEFDEFFSNFEQMFEKLGPEVQQILDDNDIDFMQLFNADKAYDDVRSLMSYAFSKAIDDLGDDVSEDLTSFVSSMVGDLEKVTIQANTFTRQHLLDDQWKQIEENAKRAFSEMSSAVNKYSSTLQQVMDYEDKFRQGLSLSGAEIANLLAEYPQLHRHLVETAEGYQIQAEGLELIKNKQREVTRVTLEESAEQHRANLIATASTLGNYGLRIAAIQSYADAIDFLETLEAEQRQAEEVALKISTALFLAHYGIRIEATESLRNAIDNANLDYDPTIAAAEALAAVLKAIEALDEGLAKLGSSLSGSNQSLEEFYHILQKIRKLESEMAVIRARDPEDIAAITNNLKLQLKAQEELYAAQRQALKITREQLASDKNNIELIRRVNDLENDALQTLTRKLNLRREITQEIEKQLEMAARLWRENLTTIEDHIMSMIAHYEQKEREALESNHKTAMDQIKEQYESRKERYRAELEDYKKMVSEKRRALQDQFKEEDYLEQLTAMRAEEADIQRQIDRLAMRTDVEGRVQRLKLQEDLAKKQTEIANFERSRQRELELQAIDDELKEKEEYYEELQDLATKNFEHEEHLQNEDYKKLKAALDARYTLENKYNMARIALVEGRFEYEAGKKKDLLEVYRKFEDETGKGFSILGETIKNEFVGAILEAQTAMQQLIGYSSQLSSGTLFEPGKGNPYNMAMEDFMVYVENKRKWEAGIDRDLAHAMNKLLRERYNIVKDIYSYSDLVGFLPQPPQYAVGTHSVPRTGMALVHEGEAIIPKKDNPFNANAFAALVAKAATFITGSTTNSTNNYSIAIAVDGVLDHTVIPNLSQRIRQEVETIEEHKNRLARRSGLFR